ncbi:MAG: DUF3445 domain-containing protein [Actinomycetota bacterium]|nr:DUF3445 domain-containing protein [Actinomycetota bacterium]
MVRPSPPAPDPDRFRWRAGLHPLDEDTWIELDDAWAAEVAAKRRLRAEVPGVFVSLDGSASRSHEAVRAIGARLLTDHPDRFSVRDGEVVLVVPSGELGSGEVAVPAVVSDHPLDRVAQVVQEDLILLDEVDGVTVTTAASVCFPTRWDPAWALGHPLAEVHGPVPRTAGRFARAIDAAIARLEPGGRGVWRHGWTLTTDPSLRLVPGERAPDPPDDPGLVGAAVWMRIERQTLRRFAGGTVLFTVRVRRWPLAEAITTAEAAADLDDQLARMPADVLDYKGLTRVVGPARRWCAEQVAALSR